MTKSHVIIPDTQIRPQDNLDFIERIGMYLVDKQPEVVVCIGDWADMASLSSYDKGKKTFEGRRYVADIEAAQEGMKRLFKPINSYNERQKKNGKKQYRPDYHLTLGNHCDRINRAINDDPKLDGTLGIDDLDYEGFGWKTYPFLEVVVVDGIAYSHYFSSGVLNRPISTAAQLLNKKHMSCIAGHQQGRQTATAYRADGKRITGIIAGSCYEHNEDYMGPQGNNHWRGLVHLHEIDDGQFDELYVSLDYLGRKYGRN